MDLIRPTQKKQTDKKQLPSELFSKELEQRVLGILLCQKAITIPNLHEIISATNKADFFFESHQIIFSHIKDLFSSGNDCVDHFMLSTELKEKGKLEHIGGEIYLFELRNYVGSVSNLTYYSRILKEKSIKRTLNAELLFIQESIQSKNTDNIISNLEQAINNAKKEAFEQEEITYLCDATDVVMSEIILAKQNGGKMNGILSGFDDLDSYTHGFQKGQFIIVAARPSMGKTALCMNMAENMCKEGYSILFFSMEMTAESLVYRILSSQTDIDHSSIQLGCLSEKEIDKLKTAQGEINKYLLAIDDRAALSPEEICRKANKIKSENKLDCIFIDYLQLSQSKGFGINKNLEIANISANLKRLAKELHIPVIAVSQLNRSLENRADKMPMMSDLRASGSLEQDADVILFVYREEIYNKTPSTEGIAVIKVAKNRNGSTGEFLLKFIPSRVKFIEKPTVMVRV